MIQLGSILAVMWLYRAKLLGSPRAACRRDPDARQFALMIIVAVHPRADRQALLLADYVQTVLYESLRVSSRSRSSPAAS